MQCHTVCQWIGFAPLQRMYSSPNNQISYHHHWSQWALADNMHHLKTDKKQQLLVNALACNKSCLLAEGERLRTSSARHTATHDYTAQDCGGSD
jgi:hypothetical protein